MLKRKSVKHSHGYYLWALVMTGLLLTGCSDDVKPTGTSGASDDTESSVDTESASMRDSASDSVGDSSADSAGDTATQSGIDTSSNTIGDTQSESSSDTVSDIPTDTESGTVADTQTDSQVDTNTNSLVDTDTGSAADTGSVADTEPASDSVTESDSAVDSETGSATDTETESAMDTASELVAVPSASAVTRGETFFGFDERFNRYYTDASWTPSAHIFVSPNGSGDGSSLDNPTDVVSGLAAASPGTQVTFLTGDYAGCFELDESQSGTYDDPIVLYGKRNADGSLGVTVTCCDSGRRTCFNFEGANYIAADGFELVGGSYGVRSVGLDYASNEHQVGIAVLNCDGHDQSRDPFFTGQSDWYVIEGCMAHDVGNDDGHGIYLSNGSDWNIARFNETYNTSSSDFQINADPLSTCNDTGIDYDSPECDAVAGDSLTGGRGASDFMWIEGNYFHHSGAQGPNFTSVRNSRVFNNIFAFPTRHGVSFWQETDNPALGASHNLVAHNLFITASNSNQALGVINDSTGNTIVNNIVVAVRVQGNSISSNPNGQLLTTDASTVDAQTFEGNIWISGTFISEDSAAAYVPNQSELRETDFDASWFANLSNATTAVIEDLMPAAGAPWLNAGAPVAQTPLDRLGQTRANPSDLGPFEE
ncbi:MAG: hypothetical protein JXX14_08685 [Deltaproteobacteria bacterium]|nr:hypothetical protein [Deltaproteobacteria bacterium]